MARRYAVLTVVVTSIIATLAFETKPLQAAATSLGASWNATQRWVSSLGSQTARPIERVASLLRPQLPEQQGGGQTGPTVTTDKQDYSPGEIIIVTGTGWLPNSQVSLTFHEVRDVQVHPDVIVWTASDANGNIDTSRPISEGGSDADDYAPEVHDLGVTYQLTATGPTAPGGAIGSAQTTFTDGNPSADLDQCANDQLPSPNTDGCSASASDWVNGNLGSSKSVYFEGDSIPYRLTFSNLSLDDLDTPANEGLHEVIIEWDTTKGGKHAIDYLTTFNRTVTTANPCLGVSPCPTPTTLAIPKDPQVDNGFGSPITQIAGVFTLYGGTLVSATAPSIPGECASPCTTLGSYSYKDGSGFSGDKTARIKITFQANQINPVLAWGGHVATRQSWGQGNSAVSITGSPYHTSLVDLDGAGGNQDRSLSADAVIFPGSLTVIKDAAPNGPTSFSFTASPSPLTNFSLVDNGTSANTKVFSNIITFQTYTINEPSVPTGWSFTSVSCSVTSPNGGSYSTTTTTAEVNMKEGEDWTCTYINTQQPGTLIVIKHVIGGTAVAGDFTMTVAGTGVQGGTTSFGGQESPGTSLSSTLVVGGDYSVSETGPSGYTDSYSTDCTGTVVAGQTKTCTVTNTRDQGYLKLTKSFDAKTSGFSGTFAVVYNCGASDQTVNLSAGGSQTVGPFDTGTQCTVTEPTLPTAPTGWTFGTPSVSGSPATITKGDQAAAVEVTVTNTIARDQGYLTLTKSFDAKSSGFSGTFDVVYNCGAGNVTVALAAGASSTVGPFDTGTSCTVTEPTLPTAPTGWTFGTPSISGSPATITKGDQAAAVTVTVTNSITRDQGYLKLTKSFDAKSSGFSGTFDVVYNCGAGNVTVALAAGASSTVGPFDTGTSCTVTEPTLPTAPTGWTFGTPSVSGSPATITKGDQAAAVTVTVTNSITRDQGYLKLTKSFDAKTSGFNGTFAVVYNCGGAGNQTVNLSAGGSQTVGPFDTGTSCTVTEPTLPTAPTGWTFGTPSISGSPATIVKGDQAAAVTVSVTNSITRDLGSLKIIKSVVGAPAGFTGSFSVDVSCTLDGGSYQNQTISYPSPGFVTIANIPTGVVCTVTEDTPTGAPTGYTWGTVTVSGTATIAKNTTSEVTVTNTVTGRAKVVKTKAGGALGAGDAFTFQLRTGASTTQLGTIVETQIATSLNQGVLNFTTVLVPGQHYQLCELVMPGWNTNLAGTLFVPGSVIPPALPNPNVDNSPVCVDFVAQAGVTTTFNVDNTFPGGLARTIGFWKNWASCAASNGKQKAVLDQTLQSAQALGGLVVSASAGTYPQFAPTIYLRLTDTNTNPDIATDCAIAVALLNKSAATGKKANDPAFNLAAQLVAAELNFFAGASKNGAVITAVNQAVLLLGKYAFNANGYTGKISNADANTMNTLATTLDNYNNNRP